MGFIVDALAAIVGAILFEFLRAIGGLKPVNAFLSLLLPRLFRWKTGAIALSILVALILSDLTPIRLGETVRVWILGLPKQEEMVVEVERAYDRGQFQNAIDRARAVITEFERSAKREQSALEDRAAPQFSEGTVPWGKIWASREVFSHGSLNSVGVAWLMIGRSQEGLGNQCEARQAYEAASKYTYAEAWDPQSWPIRGWSPYGFFWSPADDAKDRALSVSCKQ